MDKANTKMTEQEIRDKYEAVIWAAMSRATTSLGITGLDTSRHTELVGLINEVAMHGWAWKLVFGPLDGDLLGLQFYPVDVSAINAKAEAKKACMSVMSKSTRNYAEGKTKQLGLMNDRELLHYFASVVCAYDSTRDNELEFLASHPNRDAWTEDEEKDYADICNEIHEQYDVVMGFVEEIKQRRLD